MRTSRLKSLLRVDLTWSIESMTPGALKIEACKRSFKSMTAWTMKVRNEARFKIAIRRSTIARSTSPAKKKTKK